MPNDTSLVIDVAGDDLDAGVISHILDIACGMIKKDETYATIGVGGGYRGSISIDYSAKSPGAKFSVTARVRHYGGKEVLVKFFLPEEAERFSPFLVDYDAEANATGSLFLN